jgi:hypothetical protein
MTKQDLHLQEVKSEQDLMAFIRFLWEVYRETSIGSPLLSKTSSPNLAPLIPLVSIRTRFFFWPREEAKFLEGLRALLTIINIEFQQEDTGFFGFFESVKRKRGGSILFG